VTINGKVKKEMPHGIAYKGQYCVCSCRQCTEIGTMASRRPVIGIAAINHAIERVRLHVCVLAARLYVKYWILIQFHQVEEILSQIFFSQMFIHTKILLVFPFISINTEMYMNRLTIFFWVQPRTYFWNYLKVLTVYWNIKLYIFSCIFH
jgi:hypothetical protein